MTRASICPKLITAILFGVVFIGCSNAVREEPEALSPAVVLEVTSTPASAPVASSLDAAPAVSVAYRPVSAANDPRWILRPEFSDEFDGTALDSAKWDNNIGDWGNWSWEPENARVENGLLKLRMQYHEHTVQRKVAKTTAKPAGAAQEEHKLYYTSGAVRSKAPPIKYGYFEARIKTAPLYPGVSPAFWLYRNEPEVWTEMDWELTQAGAVSLNGANCFVFRHPKLTIKRAPDDRRPLIAEANNIDLKCDPRREFHVYGIEWGAKEIKWYFDGKLVRTRENTYWDQPLNLIFSLGLRKPYNTAPSPKGFPTQYEVDYVRVWQRYDN